MIEVRELVKKYGGHLAVDHLSFTVKKGQIYGFLGPNGAGKTTTMNILTGYTGMTGGKITVDGTDITENPGKVKRLMGYLPETPPLYPDMTPLEYLSFAAELKKLPAGEAMTDVLKVMELTGITDVQNRLIKNLSKGYRQRVGLSQALLGFPEILILDEPTAGLDPKQILEMRNLIKSLGGEHTIILSSHILSEVRAVCDSILIMNKGRLVAQGTPYELEKSLKNGSVELTVKSQDSLKVRDVFKKLPWVGSIQVQALPDKTVKAEISPKNPGTDIREDIFGACCKCNLPILKMDFSGMSLEQIFLKLTEEGSSEEEEETNDRDL